MILDVVGMVKAKHGGSFGSMNGTHSDVFLFRFRQFGRFAQDKLDKRINGHGHKAQDPPDHDGLRNGFGDGRPGELDTDQELGEDD